MFASSKAKNRQTGDAVKKSLIFSGLVGTTGIFIAKAIGLLYSVPFSSILQDSALMGYYGSAYRIYNYILNIFTAGFPFAIVTLVSKYETLKNYKTVLTIKRVSILFMACIGFLGMIVMAALSSLVAPVMAEGADGAKIMTYVLCILSLAVFFVPILSAYRGFVQGLREFEEYAFSQVFEQIFRVGFLLSVSCLLVYGFKMATVYALYAAVFSTSVAAVAGLVQIMLFSSRLEKGILTEARRQTSKMVALEPLFKEFVLLAIPYMISAALGYSDDVYNSILLPMGLRNSSYNVAEINTVMAAVNFAGGKLTAIPMILAPGFSAAIIPHISTHLVERNFAGIRKNVKDCFNMVLFIGMFLSFCIFLYARPLFYCAFYTDNLDLSASISRWCAIEGFFGTITPVISSVMMALRRQRQLLWRLFIGCVIKGVLMVPFTSWWGFPGAVYATAISYGYIIIMNCMTLHDVYKVKFRPVFQVIIRTSIGLAVFGWIGSFLMKAGLGAAGTPKLICLFGLMANGILSLCAFLAIEWILQVPQSVFHLKARRKA